MSEPDGGGSEDSILGAVGMFALAVSIVVLVGIGAILAVTGGYLFTVDAAPMDVAGAVSDGDGAISDADRSSATIEGHSIVQGDRCYPIEPMGNGNHSVEDFYDYRHPETDPSSYTYSSHGTTHLQEDDTSIVFLYEGTEGLSLVFVHDQLEGDTEGGALTMQINNLPEDGEWVVEDDNYSEELDTRQHEEWNHGDDWSRITWVWTEERTDGGAFAGGLDGDFSIEIDAMFNDHADFRVYDGNVTAWQALSAPEEDPERYDLDMSEPIEVRSEACSAVTGIEFTAEGDGDGDGEFTVGDNVTASATVENTGDGEESVTVPFVVDGEIVDEISVTVGAGETTTVSTDLEFDDEGEYVIDVDSHSETVAISTPDEFADRVPGFGVLVVAIAGTILLGVLAVATTRRRS